MAAPEPLNNLAAAVRELIDNTSLLFRQEVALLKAELAQTAKRLAINSVAVVVGGFLAAIGMLALLAAAILALALIMPAWLAALLVGGGFVLVGLIFILIGIRKLTSTSVTPERTIRSVENTVEMVKEKV
jgi:predicted phage tail protein